MAIEVTARHMDAKDIILDYARRQAEDITEAFSRVEHIHVVLDIEKHRHIAEVIVRAKKQARVEAIHSSDNMRTSIDAAMGKVMRRLRKGREKAQARRTRGPATRGRIGQVESSEGEEQHES